MRINAESGKAMKTKVQATVLFLTSLMFIEGCATVPKYDPFLISKTTIRATVKTVAIYHPKTNNPVEVEFERLIEGKLREGGFATIGSDRINPIADQQKQALGGLYDPQTGMEDKEKAETYWHNVLQELKTNYNVDAVLTFEVIERPAKFYGNRAEWDGTSEGIYNHYGLADVLLSNGTEYGTTRGLSLKILLSNLQRENLFLNYGGIQLASKLARPAQTFREQGFVDVPESQLFSDTNRVLNAVTNALGPLTN